MADLLNTIRDLETERSRAANEAVVFETDKGKAMARARAYAYNEALKIVRKYNPEAPQAKQLTNDEMREGGRNW